MQFVKASERMPTSTDGRKGKVVVRFLDSPKYDFWNVDSFSVDVDFYGYHYKKEMIEWLDEGNASAEEQEEGDMREDIIDMAMEDKPWDEKFEYLKSNYNITRKQ
jgi:hypothetical protein